MVDDDDIDRCWSGGATYAERAACAAAHELHFLASTMREIGDPRACRAPAGRRPAYGNRQGPPLQNLLHVIARAYLQPRAGAPAVRRRLGRATRGRAPSGRGLYRHRRRHDAVSMFAQGHLLWNDLVPGWRGNYHRESPRAWRSVLQAERSRGNWPHWQDPPPRYAATSIAGRHLPVSQRARSARCRGRRPPAARLSPPPRTQRIKGSGVARYARRRIF